MSCADADTGRVRRLEIFTGAGGRRIWVAADKAAIVAESFAGLESVCAVARRHGLSSSQLFTWRREMRRAAEAAGISLPSPVVVSEPLFVPAVIAPAPAAVVEAPPAPKRPRPSRVLAAVELEIDGVSVKIGHDAAPRVITAVIEALKTPR